MSALWAESRRRVTERSAYASRGDDDRALDSAHSLRLRSQVRATRFMHNSASSSGRAGARGLDKYFCRPHANVSVVERLAPSTHAAPRRCSSAGPSGISRTRAQRILVSLTLRSKSARGRRAIPSSTVAARGRGGAKAWRRARPSRRREGVEARGRRGAKAWRRARASRREGADGLGDQSGFFVKSPATSYCTTHGSAS